MISILTIPACLSLSSFEYTSPDHFHQFSTAGIIAIDASSDRPTNFCHGQIHKMRFTQLSRFVDLYRVHFGEKLSILYLFFYIFNFVTVILSLNVNLSFLQKIIIDLFASESPSIKSIDILTLIFFFFFFFNLSYESR